MRTVTTGAEAKMFGSAGVVALDTVIVTVVPARVPGGTCTLVNPTGAVAHASLAELNVYTRPNASGADSVRLAEVLCGAAATITFGETGAAPLQS